jgi:hypothetical protein
VFTMISAERFLEFVERATRRHPLAGAFSQPSDLQLWRFGSAWVRRIPPVDADDVNAIAAIAGVEAARIRFPWLASLGVAAALPGGSRRR